MPGTFGDRGEDDRGRVEPAPPAPPAESPSEAGIPRQELIFAAAVATLRDERSASAFEPFLPFVAEALRRQPDDEVSFEAVQRSVRDVTGLTIPQGALRTILKKAHRNGLVERRDHGVVVHRDALDTFSMLPLQERFFADHRALVADCCRFAAERFGVEIDQADAEAVLLRFVEERAALLAMRRRVEPTVAAPAGAGRADLEYVVAAYVNHVRDHDREALRYLETVVQGITWQAYLYVDDLGSVQQKFTDSVVFLDTTLALRALGYEGREMQRPARELLDLLRACGARVACLERTVDETRRVLLAVAAAIHAGARGARSHQHQSIVEQHVLEQGKPPSTVEMEAEALGSSLEAAGVEVVPSISDRPGYRSAERATLHDAFDDYQHERARSHDVDVLIEMHERRGPSAPRVLEDCRALFVTTNERHAEVAAEHFGSGAGGARWPLVMLDHHLATLLWLKRPLEVPDLPWRRVLADCYAAMRPTPAVWERFCRTLERLHSSGALHDDEYRCLRFSVGVRETLMDETRGDPDRVTDQTVEDLLDLARRPLAGRGNVTAVLQDVMREGRVQLEETEARLGERIDEMGTGLHAVVGAAVREEVTTQLREHRRAVTRRRVHAVVRTASALVAALLVTLPVVGFVAEPRFGGVVVLVEGGLLGVARGIWGRSFTVQGLFRGVEAALLAKLGAHHDRRLAFSTPEPT